MNSKLRLLSIAASDPSAGAGIQADLKTFQCLGTYGMSAITALTVQNTQGVQAIHTPPEDFLRQQIESLHGDIGFDAIKIGLCPTAAVIQTVASCLPSLHCPIVVFDPVLKSSHAEQLVCAQSLAAIRDDLLPQVKYVTPNLFEASQLLNRSIQTVDEMIDAALQLGHAYPNLAGIIITGGHLDNAQHCIDVIVDRMQDHVDTSRHRRLTTRNTHGTGCVFSSALTVYLARDQPLIEAAHNAQQFLIERLRMSRTHQIGQGTGPCWI